MSSRRKPVDGMAALQPGQRLAHYEIVELIGRGGMGEVYRAHDSKLGRDVAIKVLPDAFAEHVDRVRRFRREAKVLASLNHPGIAAIYGLERSHRTHYLVLELVAGDTLAGRIARGPIPIDEAVDIASRIAEALEEAHEHGIVHRDLKPENIKLTPDDKVKILDFGLAKAHADYTSDPVDSSSPTRTQDHTRPGVILGTAPYMSPEQARGRPVDRRADIWAFGAIVYEMLSGKRAFGGTSTADTLAAVVNARPDWDALSTKAQERVGPLLRRCLDEDVRGRLRDIGEARIALSSDATVVSRQSDQDATSPHAGRGTLLGVAVSAAALAGLVVGTSVWLVGRPAAPRVTRLSIVTAPAAALSDSLIAISPNGDQIIYASANGTQLSVRSLDDLEPRHIPVGSAAQPFVSSDGQWIGFFEGVNALRKVSMRGGPSEVVALLGGSAARGASFAPDGSIIYANDDPRTGLWRVPAAGGDPQMVSTPVPAVNQLWPQVLPGGEAVLFTESSLDVDESHLAVLDLESGTSKRLFPGASGQYVPSGHLVYATSGMLRAIAFDLERLEASGASVEVLDRVATAQGVRAGFAVAADGNTLAYVPVWSSGASRELVWVDREGNEQPLAAPPGAYVIPRISPDGTRVAVDNREPFIDIRMWDIGRQVMHRMTFQPSAYPLWTPNGERLVFTAFHAQTGTGALFWLPAAAGATPELLLAGENNRYPTSFAPGGSELLFREEAGATGLDVMRLSMNRPEQAEPLLTSPFNELNAEISPDGHWLAFTSNMSGREEVYVRPYPDVDSGLALVSNDGGRHPVWARDGRALYYRAGDGAVMHVAIELTPTFQSGAPVRVLEGGYYLGGPGRSYDVAPDGERFLMIKVSDDELSGPPSIVVVTNWLEELERLLAEDG